MCEACVDMYSLYRRIKIHTYMYEYTYVQVRTQTDKKHAFNRSVEHGEERKPAPGVMEGPK